MEKLEGTSNYNNWKFLMRMALVDFDLWKCITGEDVDPDKDQRALAKISLALKPVCFIHVRYAKSSKEAWDALQTAFEQKSTYRKLSLSRKFHRTRLENFSSMFEYINEIISVVQQLTDIGKNIDNEDVAWCLLNGLPDEYELLIMGLESTRDKTRKLTSEEVKVLLLDSACRKESIEYENALFVKDNFSSDRKKVVGSNFKLMCHHCKKEGHIRPKCPQLKKGKHMEKKDKRSNIHRF